MTILLPPATSEDYDTIVAPDLAGDREVFIASHPDLPGCMAQGNTPYEAVANLAEARELYLVGLRRRGLPVPQGKAAPMRTSATAIWS